MEHSEQDKPVTLESMIRSETPPTFHRLRFTPEEANIVKRSIGFSRHLLHEIFTKTDDESNYGHDVAMMDTTNLDYVHGRVEDMILPTAGHVAALGRIVEYYSDQAGRIEIETIQANHEAVAVLAAELLVAGNPFPDTPPSNIMDV